MTTAHDITEATSTPAGIEEPIEADSSIKTSSRRHSTEALIREILETLLFTFFMATVDRPLIIINKALGYRIDCLLVNYLYNYDKKKWSWAIKPKFSELESDDPDQILKWQQNRKTAYQGSLYHFLKSFIYGELEEEGFDIYKVEASGQKVPQQRWHHTMVEYEDYISNGITDSEKKLHFDKWLFVVYKKTATSWIGLNFKDITLDEFGYAEEDNPYEVYGNWARRAVADLLPKNYMIE